MMGNKNEILNLDDIKLLVNSFYDKVKKDEEIGTIFNNVIQDKWPEHLEKMYRFWQTILLEEHTYFGSPFLPHSKLPIDKKHFDKWLFLFHQTIDENFEGTKAQDAKIRSVKMAEMFQYKINHHRNNQNSKPVL